MAFASHHPPRRPGAHRPLADINVTPLVDVMLVLLIVFMVTAPMLAAGLKVNLPHARTAQPLPPKEPVVVSVTRGGQVALGTEAVERELLVARVMARLEGDQNRVVQVRGDRDANYGEVVAVIDLLAAGGVTKLALVSETRMKSTPEARSLSPAANVVSAAEKVASP